MGTNSKKYQNLSLTEYLLEETECGLYKSLCALYIFLIEADGECQFYLIMLPFDINLGLQDFTWVNTHI